MTEFDQYMQALRVQSLADVKKHATKRTTTRSNHKRKHNHYTMGDTGYAPSTCSNPVIIRIAKRR